MASPTPGNVITLSDYGSGFAIGVDTGDVTSAEQIAQADTASCIPGTVIKRSSGADIVVRGGLQLIRQAILNAQQSFANAAAAIAASFSGKSYAAVLVASGGGVVGQVGDFIMHSISQSGSGGGPRVIVRGTFDFTPAVAGAPETITISLPPGFAPSGPFAAASDLQGGAEIQAVAPATDACGPVQATIGAQTAEVSITSNAVGATPISIVFSYKL